MSRMTATVQITVVVSFNDDGETDLKVQAIDAVSDVWGLAWSEPAEVASIDVIGDVVPVTPTIPS